MNELTVLDGITIRSDAEGRFSLNDLFYASGGDEKNAPNRFTRSEEFKELVQQIERQNPSIKAVNVVRGRGITGTYVVKDLVYAYAMWISPEFKLKVIDTYIKLQTNGVVVAEHANDDFLENPMDYMEKLFNQAKKILARKANNRTPELT